MVQFALVALTDVFVPTISAGLFAIKPRDDVSRLRRHEFEFNGAGGENVSKPNLASPLDAVTSNPAVTMMVSLSMLLANVGFENVAG